MERHLDITILRVKADRLVAKMLVHPVWFGLANVTDPACPGCNTGLPDPDAADTLVPNPDLYLWWDFIHLTRVAHERIGALAADAIDDDYDD